MKKARREQPEPAKPRDETDVLLDFAAQVGERFPDFVLIVRTRDGFTQWRASNIPWALGAIEQYRTAKHTEQSVLQARAMGREEGS